MGNFVSPAADYFNSAVEAFVDIYPLTGGQYTITGSSSTTTSQLLSLHTMKFIRGQSSPGTFSMQLAPGGPKGVNGVSWTQVITQFSLCIIYFRRGSSNQTVMVGVVDQISERQTWTSNGVQRVITITGYDFSVYLMTFAYYVLDFLGIAQANLALGGPPGVATLYTVGDLVGNPADVGNFWFSKVFLGTLKSSPTIQTSAALQLTYLRYKGTSYYLNQLWTAWFDQLVLPNVTGNTVIPFLSNFLVQQGTFWSKFSDITPWPFYEMFVNTAPVGYYQDAPAPQITFTPSVGGIKPAQVIMVARNNPLPWILLDSNNPNGATPQWISNYWDNILDTFTLAPASFTEADVNYSTEDISNFYAMDPTCILTAYGNDSGNIQAAIAQMGFMYDQNSINRYGFRSQIHSTMWWADPLGVTAKVAAQGTTVATATYPGTAQYISLLSRFVSLYEPLPNMLRGEVNFPLWPDLIVGNRFRCYPFKDSNEYTFYMTGVQHDWVFGGPSLSKVIVERGLKTSDYQNIAGIMIPLFQGNIDRIDGTLQPRSDPGRGLTYVPGATLNPVTTGAFFLANGVGARGGL